MALIDTNALTVAQSPDVARTQVSPSSAANRLVHDTTPLDPSAERYLRRSLLGAGGMGEVHLCRDAHIEREVAMKVARGGSDANAELRGRFIHEARVQGQLEHPSIVPVYDLGVRPDGAAFFTMKRVRGRTLGDVLGLLRSGDADARQHFTRRRLLTAFSSVCMAVHFAHTRGVLHRDLKPSNVMLGDFGEVYVLDWGLAKVVGEMEQVGGEQSPAGADEPPRSASGGQTVDGALLGTPGFMSPEQARGRIQELDARTDVYSLGAMLFELLTLAPLHEQSNVADVILSTLEGAEARPSVRVPEGDVPPELEAICVRATALDREERYGSAGEIAADIERFLDGDRDLALRRSLSSEHAHQAAEAARRAIAGGDQAASDHALAMREVGRALAMNPDNDEAMRTLVDLLSHAPAKLPAEAKAMVDDERRALQREGGMLGGVAYLSWLLYVPLIFWMGLRNLTLGLVVLGCGLLSAVFSLRLVRNPTRDGRIPYPLLISSFGAVTLFSFMFGPFILVSGMAAVNAIAFILGAGRLRRGATIALACGASVLPAVLEWMGVWPHSYAFTHDGMLMLPRLLRYSRPATEIFLVVANVAFVITTAMLASRFRDVLSAAEEKLHFHAWQLRQLMPPSASDTKAGAV